MQTESARSFQLRYDILRNGAIYAQAVVAGPAAVSMDSRRKLKQVFSGDMLLPDGIQRLTDRFRPVVLLDGVEYPVGQFVLTSVEKIWQEGGWIDRCEGYDLCFLVKRTRLEERLFCGKGERYLDKIQQLLQQCGIDSALVEDCAETFATDREDWEIGTSVLDVVNDLLDEINYQSLWFDQDGVARIQAIREPGIHQIQHWYGPSRQDGYALVKDGYTRQDDLFDVSNVFVVQCENPELDTVMQAVSVNDDPDSALSVIRQGRVMAPVVKLDNVSSQQALQRYADRLRWQSMTATETTVIQTALNPVHLCGDILALEGDLAPGIYEETAWAMELAPGGMMEHTLRRVLYL